MKSFFKTFLAALLGNIIATGVVAGFGFFFGLVLLFAIIGGSAEKPHINVKRQSFLVLDLNMSISDSPEHYGDGLGAIIGGASPRIALWDLLNSLEAAAKDKRIAGLFITGNLLSENYASGYATLAEVRRAISEFKNSGKPVVAYLEQPSPKDYYVATAASDVFLHPYGNLPVHGFASSSPYFGEALRKYGIGVQTTKVGKFKSAVEPFIAEKMSDPAREQLQVLLDSIWSQVVVDISKDRKLGVGAMQEIADTVAILDAQAALKNKMVDGVAYLDEMIKLLKTKGAEDADTHSFAQVNILDYSRSQPKHKDSDTPLVAIVYAEGDIVDGWQNTGAVGGNWLAAKLRELRMQENVVAVVLRVNSPGGSAFASELIQREVRLLSESGKPVVVSMGSMAASGGYWISAYADKIFAEKTTITGSIGVFGLMFNVQDIAKNFGINFDGVKTAKLADIESFSRPKNADELVVLQTLTDQIYDAFLDKVAEGRKLERTHVAKIAEGRVWAGAAAKDLQLVDTFGGLREAVADAALRAGVSTHYFVRQYPETQTTWEALAQAFAQPEGVPPIVRSGTSGPSAKMAKQFSDVWNMMERLNDRRGIYARLPYQTDLE